MKSQQLNSYAHCVYKIFYHIVFVTKYRKKVLTPKILEQLKKHFSRLCINANCKLMEMNGEADHVHLLIDASPNIQPSRLVNTLKTISSREIRKEFAEELRLHYQKPVLWSRAYCIVSAGGAPLSVLKQYIKNQGKNPG